jgi:hypothetical protein
MAVGDRSGGFGGVGGGGSGEVAVFEAATVALEREDLGVVDEAVDHRGGGDFVAQFAQAEKKKGLLDVTISEARS